MRKDAPFMAQGEGRPKLMSRSLQAKLQDIEQIERAIDQKFKGRQQAPPSPDPTPPPSSPLEEFPVEDLLSPTTEDCEPTASIPPVQEHPQPAAPSPEFDEQTSVPDDILFQILTSEPPATVEKQPSPQPPQKHKLRLAVRLRRTQLNVEKSKEKLKPAPKPENKRGEMVYLADTGEPLGVITEAVIDDHHKMTGYKIKPEGGSTPLWFPTEHFTDVGNGLIFTPRWYLNAISTLERLEFKQKISPEIACLLDMNETNPELSNLLVRRDPEFTADFEAAALLDHILASQQRICQERLKDLEQHAHQLMTKRLLENLDRKTFSDQVQDLRYKMKILEATAEKCTTLTARLHQTTYGALLDHNRSGLLASLEHQSQSTVPTP